MRFWSKEGGEVEEGQVVLRLDDRVTRSTLGAVRSQLNEQMARKARLLADADAIAFPAPLTARGNKTYQLPQRRGCSSPARRRRPSQRAQLRERVAQLNEEVRGLSAQQAAKESELDLMGKELVGVAELYHKNLVSISRYTRLQGERGQIIAALPARGARLAKPSSKLSRLTGIPDRSA